MSVLEYELEEALDDMEFGGKLTEHQIYLIRFACGKQKKVNVAINEAFDSMFPEVEQFFSKGLSAPVSRKS